MTPREALENTTRLLQAAEMETNPVTMERLDDLAMSWLNVAGMLIEHADVLN